MLYCLFLSHHACLSLYLSAYALDVFCIPRFSCHMCLFCRDPYHSTHTLSPTPIEPNRPIKPDHNRGANHTFPFTVATCFSFVVVIITQSLLQIARNARPQFHRNRRGASDWHAQGARACQKPQGCVAVHGPGGGGHCTAILHDHPTVRTLLFCSKMHNTHIVLA